MVYSDGTRLVADYFEELVRFGATLGLQLVQLCDMNAGRRRTHFDLSPAQAARALRRGAVPMNWERCLVIAWDMSREGEDRIMAGSLESYAPASLRVMDGRTGQTEAF